MATLRAWIVRRPLVSYVLLAYAFSWAWWWPLLGADAPVRVGIGWPTHLPGLMGPALSAVLVISSCEGRTGLLRLARRVVRWRIGLAWLSVLGLLVAGVAAAMVTGALGQGPVDAGVSWTAYPGLPAAWGPLAGFLIVLVANGLGEEIGWRGFAVERLARRRSLLTTAVWVAVIWAPWHLPLFFVQASFAAFGLTEIVGWVVGLTAGSLVLTWLYLRAGHSTLLVAVWHTVFNFTSATPAAAGAMAATTSTMVMFAAVAIVIHEVWRTPRSRPDSASPAVQGMR